MIRNLYVVELTSDRDEDDGIAEGIDECRDENPEIVNGQPVDLVILQKEPRFGSGFVIARGAGSTPFQIKNTDSVYPTPASSYAV